MAAIYQNAVGVLLQATLPSTLSLIGATVRSFLRKPNKTLIEVPATLLGSQVSYTTKMGDLDEAGEYSWQVIVEYLSVPQSFPTDPIIFNVWPNDRVGSGPC